jgi:hypothetical protein
VGGKGKGKEKASPFIEGYRNSSTGRERGLGYVNSFINTIYN